MTAAPGGRGMLDAAARIRLARRRARADAAATHAYLKRVSAEARLVLVYSDPNEAGSTTRARLAGELADAESVGCAARAIRRAGRAWQMGRAGGLTSRKVLHG